MTLIRKPPDYDSNTRFDDNSLCIKVMYKDILDLVSEAIRFVENNPGIVIAALALAVSVYTAFTTRKHHCLSCQPHLDTWIDERWRDGCLFYELILQNNGIGPARILDVQVNVDGTQVVSSKPVLAGLEMMLGHHKDCIVMTSSFRRGYCIAANKAIRLFLIQATNNDTKWSEVIHSAQLIIRYESFYKEEMEAHDSHAYR